MRNETLERAEEPPPSNSCTVMSKICTVQYEYSMYLIYTLNFQKAIIIKLFFLPVSQLLYTNFLQKVTRKYVHLPKLLFKVEFKKEILCSFYSSGESGVTFPFLLVIFFKCIAILAHFIC